MVCAGARRRAERGGSDVGVRVRQDRRQPGRRGGTGARVGRDRTPPSARDRAQEGGERRLGGWRRLFRGGGPAGARLTVSRPAQELRGFGRLEDLLRVKGITARTLELNRQRVTCSHRPETPDGAQGSPRAGREAAGARSLASPSQDGGGAGGRRGEVAAVRSPGGPERSPERGGRTSSPRGSGESEEESESSDEAGGDGYFYYTVDERWIDYVERTEGGGLLQHSRSKVGKTGRGCEEPAGQASHSVAGFEVLRLCRFGRSLI